MEVIIKGGRYNTETAKLLGERVFKTHFGGCHVERLYKTHDGHFFIHDQDKNGNSDCVTRTSIRLCSTDEAYAWADKYSLEAQMRLSEAHPPMTAKDLILLADYRSGTHSNPKNYIHHVVFFAPDWSEYFIASNRLMEPLDYKTQVVSVSGVEGVKDFCERMCVRSMCEEYARAWAEDHLPPRVYAKCFGSADA